MEVEEEEVDGSLAIAEDVSVDAAAVLTFEAKLEAFLLDWRLYFRLPLASVSWRCLTPLPKGSDRQHRLDNFASNTASWPCTQSGCFEGQTGCEHQSTHHHVNQRKHTKPCFH